MINFRLYRSAQTPANRDRKKAGRNPQMIDIVIIMPDSVSSVIYPVIAYCTSIDPKSEIVWPERKRIVFFFQLLLISI